MAFNSFLFLFFLLITVTIFNLTPGRARLKILFCFGYIWYAMWSIKLSIFLFLYTVTSYFPLKALMSVKNTEIRKKCIFLILILQTTPLIYFKYTNFLLDNISLVTSKLFSYQVAQSFEILLPLGISFYVFQSISFSLDCVKQRKFLSQGFIEYSTYISFFPQLVAGPIVRFKTFQKNVKQITSNVALPDIAEGVKRIVIGLALKLLLADTLGVPVNQFFTTEFAGLSGWDVWTIAFLFGFQIYFDFSAYSQIAIGSALLFGIRLSDNFNYPYLAVTPKDFWLRWHISLSSWVRDYLYVPLLKKSKLNKQKDGLTAKFSYSSISLLISWTIMGLWHGASWNFLLWGIGHAVLILLFRVKDILFSRLDNLFTNAFSYLLTISGVMALWIPFRAETVNDTLDLWQILLNPSSYTTLQLNGNVYLLALTALLVFYFAGLFRWQILAKLNGQVENMLTVVFISSLLALILIFLQVKQQFIYFQF